MEKDIKLEDGKRTDYISAIVFLNQDSNYYIFKKVTKFSEALYMISDLLSSSEPLKMSLRKIGSSLLESFSSYKSGVLPENIIPILMVLERQIHLGVVASLISHMNGEIIKSEISLLVSEIKNVTKSAGVVFPPITEDFFKVGTLELKAGDSYKGHSSNNVLYNNYKSFKKEDQRENRTLRNDIVSIKDTKNIQPSKEQRRSLILDIIKKSTGPVSIKDVVEKIKDCSEKTIQRELTDLLDTGLIKKTGERRWSKYFI